MKGFCVPGIAAMVLLGSCGGGDAGSNSNSAGMAADAVTAEIQDYEAKSRAATAMTAVDATIGDSSAMPADSNVPIALETHSPNESASNAQATSERPAPPPGQNEMEALPSIAE